MGNFIDAGYSVPEKMQEKFSKFFLEHRYEHHAYGHSESGYSMFDDSDLKRWCPTVKIPHKDKDKIKELVNDIFDEIDEYDYIDLGEKTKDALRSILENKIKNYII